MVTSVANLLLHVLNYLAFDALPLIHLPSQRRGG